MRCFLFVALCLTTLTVAGQPVTIKFITRSELGTEMTAVTPMHIITKEGTFNSREIRRMTFTMTMPDSSSLKQLRDFGIEVIYKPKLVKEKPKKAVDTAIVAKPKPIPLTRQMVTILLKNRNEVETELMAVTTVQIITKGGPFNFREVERMTFTEAMPDSASLKQLRDFGIDVKQKVKTREEEPAPVGRQMVTMRFKNRSNMATEMTAVTSMQVITKDGPFNSKEITEMTFMEAIPDSASLKQLRDFGINVRLKPSDPGSPGSASFGIGLGLDYGGIGTKLTIMPGSTVSWFAGVGYNLNDVGFNGGLELNFTPKKRSTAFLSAMYGYNGWVKPASYYGPQEATTYYGPSFGLGLKARTKKSNNYFSFQFIFPIRDPKLKSAVASDDANPIYPLLFSLGFHF